MNALKGILAFLLSSYVVFWFYELIYNVIPWLNISLSHIGSLTLWQVVGAILLFVPGLFPFLIIDFALWVMVVFD